MGIKPYSGYYGFLDYFEKKIRVVASKLMDVNNGIICRILASPQNYKSVCFSTIEELNRELFHDQSKRADLICNGMFSVLGNELKIEEPVEWSKDYLSGYVWTKGRYFRKYVQVDLTNTADVKIPRELSRFHFALHLGIAYNLTRLDKYYECFRNLISSWLNENPFMHSINWGCTQDVAVRAVNWIWAAALFKDKLVQDKDFYQSFTKSLFEHGVYVYFHPEKQAYNNHNHYLGDLVGQIYLGLVFYREKSGREWLDWGIKELFREMRYQVLPTGPSYERSTNYHRFVTEMCLSAIIQLKKNGFEIPMDIWFRMEKMLEFIMYYTKPDGKAPVIGDQDDARLHPFAFEHNLAHASLLTVGAVLFNRSDFKAMSPIYNLDGALLLGNESEHKFNDLAEVKLDLGSKSFPDAGFYIIRQKNDYMFINNSGKSKNPELGGGTHTHSDLLSFELYIEDKCFLVDPGSYIYSADPAVRMQFRSTAMHNTVVIDRQNQNNLDKNILWDFMRDAIPKTLLWTDTEAETVFEGEHNGYKRLKQPAIHNRRILYNKLNRDWMITDRLEGGGRHIVEIYFHFDVGIPIEYKNCVLSTHCQEGVNIELVFDSSTELKGSIEDNWVSKSYSHREKAKVFKLYCETEFPLLIETRIVRRQSETSL